MTDDILEEIRQAPAEAQRWYRELIVTAHHEAGHAVAAVWTDCEVREVTVVPAPGPLGRCTFRPPRRTPERMRHEALRRHLAGPAAEAILLGLRAMDVAEAEARIAGGATDFGAARGACAPASAWWLARQLERGWSRVLILLERDWTAVQRLAAELLAAGVISGDRMRDLIHGA